MSKKKKGLKLYPFIGLIIVGGFFKSKANTSYADEIDDELGYSDSFEEDNVNDQIVIDYYNNEFNELQSYINEQNIDAIITKGKFIISNLIEFIFFDGDIMGVTFDKITSNTKKIIYSGFLITSDLLEVYAPEYKEALSDKYQAILDYIIPKYNDCKEFIGEENIDKLKEIYESTKQIALDLIQKGNERLLK